MHIKKAILIFIFIVLSETFAQAKILNFNQFNTAFTNYVQKPSSEAILEITQYISESDILSKKNIKAPLQGFYMGILHKNPLDFEKIIKMQLSEDTQNILSFSKSFSKDMEDILDNKIKYYPENPAFLDMLWGYFYATTDNRVLKKMCFIQNNDNDIFIRSAAQWSYKSNMQQFKDIIKNCNQY